MSPVTLLDRRPGECAFPVDGEGADAVFCGARAGARRPGYCDEHAARMGSGPTAPTNLDWYVQLGPVLINRATRAAGAPAALDATFRRA